MVRLALSDGDKSVHEHSKPKPQTIQTGYYELKGGRIIPLDGSSVELTSTWRFDKYKDVAEQQFLSELLDLIAKSSRSIQGKR